MISLIVDAAKTALRHFSEKSERKHQREIAVIDNQSRLAQSEQSHNSAWEMQALKYDDKFIRRFSYVAITCPILLAFASPDLASQAFDGLSSVPAWWVQAWVGINGAVWGISKLKTTAAFVADAVVRLRK